MIKYNHVLSIMKINFIKIIHKKFSMDGKETSKQLKLDKTIFLFDIDGTLTRSRQVRILPLLLNS